MFTGIVEELGTLAAFEDLGEAARLTVSGPLVAKDAAPGDSIAVNGVCLTVVDHEGDEFTADVMAETLNRSSLGVLAVGSRVNLERPTAVGARTIAIDPKTHRLYLPTAKLTPPEKAGDRPKVTPGTFEVIEIGEP